MNINKYIKCIDRFDNEIKDGDSVDVQLDGIHKVYLKNGQLHFKPYGKENRVCDYFPNDLFKLDDKGNKNEY